MAVSPVKDVREIETVHFGVKPELVPYFEGAFYPRYVVTDGDGWEVWGDKPGTAGNDRSTLHVSITGPDSGSILKALAKSPLKSTLVPLGPPWAGVVVVVTDPKDWSEVSRSVVMSDLISGRV